MEELHREVAQQRVAQAITTCETNDTELCLRSGRFKVTIDWEDFDGNTGQGRVSSLRTDDSGLFYFFDQDNWEVLVKVIDGCAVTGHQWVFSAASTNVQYTLTVTDRANGCTDTDTVTVIDDTEPPTADAGPDTEVTCDEPEATLEGSASGGNDSQGYTYEWRPSADVSDPNSPTSTTTA